MTFMTLGHNDLAETRHKRAIPEQLKERRTRLKLSRKQVAADLGFDPSALQRWEMDAENPHHRQIKAADYERLIAYYDAKESERHKADVPRGTIRETVTQYGPSDPSAARFPVANLLRLPAVRARLSAIRSELIEQGATPEQEESVMRTITDRELLSRFAGDAETTEQQILLAIDNIAETARRFLSGPTL